MEEMDTCTVGSDSSEIQLSKSSLIQPPQIMEICCALNGKYCTVSNLGAERCSLLEWKKLRNGQRAL